MKDLKIVVLIILIVALIWGIIGCFLFVGYKATKKVSNEVKQVINETIKEGGYNERIKELLADEKEVEKKWLIDKKSIPYDLTKEDVRIYEIKQTYLCFDPEMRVRDYNNGASYEYTIKTNMTEDGLVRDEVNLTINKEQYDNLIKKKEGSTIEKTRYQFFADNQVIAIDIFHGKLDGLAYMEIEFANEEEAKNYQTPSWVIKDVTDDINYKNGHLARYGIPEK